MLSVRHNCLCLIKTCVMNCVLPSCYSCISNVFVFTSINYFCQKIAISFALFASHFVGSTRILRTIL